MNMNKNVWLTSDWHFGHNKEHIWRRRGFSCVAEHDEALIARFNSLVKQGDDVYFLGDISGDSVCRGIECVKRLNGNIIWIVGNHDTPRMVADFLDGCKNIVDCRNAETIFFDENSFYLSHYPCITSNFDSVFGSEPKCISVHGHTHAAQARSACLPLSYHVGVDSHMGLPVNLYSIISEFRRDGIL